jgi:hypothetical protein
VQRCRNCVERRRPRCARRCFRRTHRNEILKEPSARSQSPHWMHSAHSVPIPGCGSRATEQSP